MSTNRISLVLLIFIIILSGCKTKQNVSKTIKVDSISSSIADIIKDENFTIEISYPWIMPNNSCESAKNDDTKMNDPPKNQYTKIAFGKDTSLPIIPGTNIKINASKKNKQKIEQKTTLKNNGTVEDNSVKSNLSERQFVIFVIVLIIFICLSVRNAKKVREKFGG